jgi:hypothetical protein
MKLIKTKKKKSTMTCQLYRQNYWWY